MIRYLRIEEVTYGEPVELSVLVPLLELELVDYRVAEANVYLISERDLAVVRSMLRLATDLGINPAGIETIMHMRQRITHMQNEINRLRQKSVGSSHRLTIEAEDI